MEIEEAHGECGMDVMVVTAAGRPSQERFFSREARRGLQVVVGGVLAVAVVSYAAAGGGAAEAPALQHGGLASKLYAWTNSNDKSRGYRSSVISGLDADDPSFGPPRARVPPVDRVIAQLKHQPDPEYYDSKDKARAYAANPDHYVRGADTSDLEDSGSWSVVDPAATDDAQFNINLLMRKGGRIARDASELAGLQQEDQQITHQFEYASKRAASLLTLEGDMKAEMQELSTKQLSIIDQLKNITVNETAESEAAETQAAASEGGAEDGEGQESEDPDAPGPGDEGGAEEKARGREPMLAARKGKSVLERHIFVHAEQEARRVALARDIKSIIRKIPAAQRSVREVNGGDRDESVEWRVELAGKRAEKTAAKVGSLLNEATVDVEREARKQQQQRKQHAQHVQLEHALQEKHLLLQREASLRRERDEREAMLRAQHEAHDESLRMKQRVEKEKAENKRGKLPHHARLPVRHTGPP